jgi:hypothetical protein
MFKREGGASSGAKEKELIVRKKEGSEEDCRRYYVLCYRSSVRIQLIFLLFEHLEK